jgi:hypothetical protein
LDDAHIGDVVGGKAVETKPHGIGAGGGLVMLPQYLVSHGAFGGIPAGGGGQRNAEGAAVRAAGGFRLGGGNRLPRIKNIYTGFRIMYHGFVLSHRK